MNLSGLAALLAVPVSVFVALVASRSSFGVVARIKRLHELEQITPDPSIELDTLRAARKQITRRYAIAQAVEGRPYRWWQFIPIVLLAVVCFGVVLISSGWVNTAANALVGGSIAFMGFAIADLVRTRRDRVRSRAQFDAILRRAEGEQDPFSWSKADPPASDS